MITDAQVEAAAMAIYHRSCAEADDGERPLPSWSHLDASARRLYLDFGRAAIEAAEAAAWVRVEDAPKDWTRGKWVLGWWPSSNVRDMAHWAFDGRSGWTDGRKSLTPTHLRPLPAPPRSDRKAGDHVQCDADQAMIAAAPTMYVALKSIKGLLSAASMDDKSEAVRESNINLAWHEADRALAAASGGGQDG